MKIPLILLSFFALASIAIADPTGTGTTTYYPDQGTEIYTPSQEEIDYEESDWKGYTGESYVPPKAIIVPEYTPPRAIIVPEYETYYYEDVYEEVYYDYTPSYGGSQNFEYTNTNINYAPSYGTGVKNFDYVPTNINYDPSYGTGVQYQESIYVSCFPNKYKANKGENVEWTVTVNSSSAATYSWKGENIEGKTTSRVNTSYSSTGEKTASVNVQFDGNSTEYTCGSIYIEEPPLYISCSPNYSYIEEGGEIRWNADISGGDGSYDLEWSGHKEINGENDYSTTIEYEDPGSYSADLKVTSGSQTRTVYCGNVSVSGSYVYPFSASCNPNKSYAHPDEVIEWKVNTIGGKGNYKYEWRGTDPIDGKEGKTVKVRYTTLGEKYAEVEACSNNDCEDIQCGGVTISDKPEFGTLTYTPSYGNLEGSCIANKTDIAVGEEVTWQATVNQPLPSSLFVWNGTDGINGLRGDRQIVTYNSPGSKEASFSIRTDSGELFSFVCPSTVNVRPLEAGSGLLSLGQVPYTGPGDVLKVVGLILLLMVWSGVTVIIIRRKIGKRKISNIIDKFKEENLHHN